MKNQLPEIAIGNDQNALLLPGDRKHVLISKAGQEIEGNAGHRSHVRADGNQPEISALIEEELHRGVASDTAPFGGLGETSSPVTTAFA
jgi:hypothetical protein